MDNNVRINTYLRDTGYCSRRKADELIASGNVKVNGAVVQQMGVDIGEDDVVVKAESTETFITSVSKQNPDARVTVFENTDHIGVLQRAWLENGTELLNWLLQ